MRTYTGIFVNWRDLSTFSNVWMSFDTLSLSSSLVISTSLFRLRCHTYRRKLEPVLQRFQLQERYLPAWRIHAEFGKVRLSCSFPLSRCTCDNQVSLLWELWKLWNPSIASSSWKLLCIPWCTILDIVKLKRFKKKKYTTILDAMSFSKTTYAFSFKRF